MSAFEISGPQYRPQSVKVEQRDGQWCVVDASMRLPNGDVFIHVTPHVSYGRAEHAARTRRATIKGALTRRANKRHAARTAACEAAGVTWSWLRADMTAAEADAWLGLDS